MRRVPPHEEPPELDPFLRGVAARPLVIQRKAISDLTSPTAFMLQGHWSETVKAAEPLNGPSMTAYRNLAKVRLEFSVGYLKIVQTPRFSATKASGCMPLPGGECSPPS